MFRLPSWIEKVKFPLEVSTENAFLTAILHSGLSNDSFFSHPIYFFQFSFGLLFPFSLWTSISGFSLDFYFPFLFELLSPFSFWIFISLLFPFYFGFLFSFFSLGFFQSRSHFGFFFCSVKIS